MAGVAKYFEGHVYNKFNEQIDFNNPKYKGKIIGLYFSAYWCSPCCGFTPTLTDFYKTYGKEKNFEVIFLSSDHDEQSFDDYYKKMPWLKYDYKERKKKERLAKKFKVTGIPALVLVDGDSGDVICSDAIDQIHDEDREGKYFPWKKDK
ncbi:unnamed protein product [Adineta steineri]|uniref:protein-disulfide reductase n=1 Tax=Adineta steineri TaxID=433720 RepID=A0A814MP96_9BILA|nr:unnamed protein product [Adineta steineri]CAF0738907.1 unnamed protein product [Adineta steineri]CAF0770004.1 unnamed protein product [Adineta steineri]CAF1079192.1 unnamed protein product [Adineta steineri]CAF1405958.1 unnamed protein product [Adineta steineri]